MTKRFILGAAALVAASAILTGCAATSEANEPEPTGNTNTLFWAVAESYSVPGLDRRNEKLRPEVEAMAREACSGWRNGLTMDATQQAISESTDPATVHAVFIAAATVYCPAFKNLVVKLHG